MSSENDVRDVLTPEEHAALERRGLGPEQQVATEKLRQQVRSERQESQQAQAPDWDAAAAELVKALRSRPPRRRIRAGLPLDLAEGITRFLRLKSDEDAEAFRRNWPQFFPPAFWLYFVPVAPDSPVVATPAVAATDAEAEKERERLKRAMEWLQRQPPIPLWRAWQQLLRAAWQTGFDRDSTAQLLNINLPDEHAFSALPPLQPSERTFEFAPAWDFQRAVLGVAFENWRAKFCGRCGQPFVAEKPKNKYCGVACSGEVIGNRKVSYWRANRKRLNAKRRRKYLAGHPRARRKAKGRNRKLNRRARAA